MTRRGWILLGCAVAVVVVGQSIAITVGRDPGPPVADLPLEINVGAVNPAVTQANIATTICVKGWTKMVRPPTRYTDPIKLHLIAILPADRSHRKKDYELDHVVPLEVAGAPYDQANLALQPWKGPTGAHIKDGVENRVHDLVCAGAITLAAGQQCFLTDWRRCP